MLADRNLNVGLGCNSEQPLPNGDRLLALIEPDFEYLVGSRQLPNELLELTLLLLTLSGRRAQFTWPLGCLCP